MGIKKIFNFTFQVFLIALQESKIKYLSLVHTRS